MRPRRPLILYCEDGGTAALHSFVPATRLRLRVTLPAHLSDVLLAVETELPSNPALLLLTTGAPELAHIDELHRVAVLSPCPTLIVRPVVTLKKQGAPSEISIQTGELAHLIDIAFKRKRAPRTAGKTVLAGKLCLVCGSQCRRLPTSGPADIRKNRGFEQEHFSEPFTRWDLGAPAQYGN